MIRPLNLIALIAPLFFGACASLNQTANPTIFPQTAKETPRHGATGSTTTCPCVYVANAGGPYVTVYGSGAIGNVAPIQYIHGKKTGLQEPWGIAVDASRNIYLADVFGGYQGEGSVAVFAAGATGNVSPSQVITGPNTGLHSPFWVAVSPVNDDIYVFTEGTRCTYNGLCILIFAPGSNGNAAPIGKIDGSNTDIGSGSGIALDSSGNIYLANGGGPPSGHDHVNVYAAGSEGNVAPIQMISGSNTGLNGPVGLAVDSNANIFVDNYSSGHGGNGSVVVFAAGSNGNASPTRTIKGRRTKLVGGGIAVDGSGNLFAPNSQADIYPNVTDWIAVYGAGANGNVKPLYKIGGGRTKLAGPTAVAIK